MTEISIGEKEKRTNKGTDKQYLAVFVTQYNSSLSSFVPNFRILTSVNAEKSLTGKKVYKQINKQTNIITEKSKTIYPLLDGWLRMGLLLLLGNFADISYLVKNLKPSLLRDVCTLCVGALVCKSL